MKAAERNKILQERNLKALRNSNKPPTPDLPKDPRQRKPANDPPLTAKQIETIKKETVRKLAATRVSEEFLQTAKDNAHVFKALDEHPEEAIQLICFLVAVIFTLLLVEITA